MFDDDTVSTMYVASSDIKTSFDVAHPSVTVHVLLKTKVRDF